MMSDELAETDVVEINGLTEEEANPSGSQVIGGGAYCWGERNLQPSRDQKSRSEPPTG